MNGSVFAAVSGELPNASELIDGINGCKADIIVMFPFHYARLIEGLHGHIKWFQSISAGENVFLNALTIMSNTIEYIP
jgi:hypothetical protein